MPDLFEKDLNDAIKAVPMGPAWAETLHRLLKEKRRITRKTR